MKDMENKLVLSWETNANAWTQSVREQQIESRRLVTNRVIVDEITGYHPKRVLDVGCGEGWLARALSRNGIEVVGIDGSSSLIKQASEWGGGTFHHLNYTQICEEPTRLGGTFDVIVCNFSILSEDIQLFLQSLSSLLSSEGVLMIHTLHPFMIASRERYEDGWQTESFTGMGEGYKTEMPWYFRTTSSWIQELSDAGLQLKSCKEPIHPVTGKPLSLLLKAGKA